MDTLRNRYREDELLRVAEQAASWCITLEEATAEERAAFAQWIEESPLHLDMFLRTSAAGRMGELLSAPDRTALSAQARMATDAPNIVPLDSRSTEPLSASRPATRRRSQRVLTGVAAATAAAVIGLFAWWHLSWERYTTDIGEQRSVSLDDGSIVYANTGTRVDVRYSEDARDLRLITGEALFKVEPDPARPFRVHIEGTVVEAVGTQFNLYRRPGQTTVAVIEGRVKAGSAHLHAGQALNIASNGRVGQPFTVDIGRVTAWRQRRLIFEWETLESIAAELNRYNRTPRIRIEGAEVGARRYTAAFEADNPRMLVKFLASEDDLAVTRQGDELVVRMRD